MVNIFLLLFSCFNCHLIVFLICWVHIICFDNSLICLFQPVSWCFRLILPMPTWPIHINTLKNPLQNHILNRYNSLGFKKRSLIIVCRENFRTKCIRSERNSLISPRMWMNFEAIFWSTVKKKSFEAKSRKFTFDMQILKC